MSALWTYKDQTTKKEIRQIDGAELGLKRPTVVFLTGVSTTGAKPQYVAGGLSHAHKMLDSFGLQKTKDCDVFAWGYEKKRQNFKNTFCYNSFPKTYASKEAHVFFNTYLLQHLADNVTFKKNGRVASGDAKPVAEVEASLKNLTLMSYSYGSVFGQEIYNASKASMKKLGYTEKQTRYLLSRIHLISMGVISRPEKERNRYTSINLVATNDVISNHKRRIWWSLRETFASYAGKLHIEPFAKRTLRIVAPVQNDIVEPTVDKQGNVAMRGIKKLFPKWWVRDSYHELPHYTTDNEEHNSFAKIARFALINCVERTKALSPLQMIEPPKSVQEATAEMKQACAAYQEKIKQAMKRKA